MRGVRAVSYHHLMLPAHDLLLAEGCAAESFYPGAQALAALTLTDRLALAHALDLAPEAALETAAIARAYGPRCLPLAARAELRGLTLARPMAQSAA